MKTLLLLCSVVAFWATAGHAQTIDFGRTSQPLDTETVDPLIYYGEDLEFEGGYHIGDQVGDFTVYSFDGDALNLSATLANGKPTILLSGSVSCPRFTNAFVSGSFHPGYTSMSTIMTNHYDSFNWVVIYGVEAHPGEGDCPSNCPPGIQNDTLVIQHQDYHYRRYAGGTLIQGSEYNFPMTIYADNPDNSVYNNFFQRPFGSLVVDCTGEVLMRGEWAHIMFNQHIEDLLELANNAPCELIVDEEEPVDETPDDEDGDETEEPDEDDVVIDEDDEEVGMWSGPNYDLYATDLVRMYPNPSATFTTLEIPAAFFTSAVMVRFYDFHGRVAFEQRLTGTLNQIGIGELANGSYLVEIINFEGERMMTRFIKA